MAEDAVAVSPPEPLDHHKRKHDDLDQPQPAAEDPNLDRKEGEEERKEIVVEEVDSANESKRPRFDDDADGLASENGHKLGKEEPTPENTETETAVDDTIGGDEKPNDVVDGVGNEALAIPENEQKDNAELPSVDDAQPENGQLPPSGDSQLENAEKPHEDELHQPATGVSQQGDATSNEPQSQSVGPVTRRIEVPNNKVGVLIGKAGDTIKYLQYNSGAKIQITRDADADPRAPTRPVELIGSLENISKAEKLINDVIAEADAGGSPALVARGFNAALPPGSGDQFEMQVPNEKVGLIIGKGGETIKSLQTRSGARIQLIPNLPEGGRPRERTVRISGARRQIDMAKELINEVMSQQVRPSSHSSHDSHQGHRPRGPTGTPHWGSPGPHPSQPTPYGYQQRGPYQSQSHQYPPSQSYGGYPSQGPPRSSNFGSGWDHHRPPMQQGPPPPHSGGYDYYGQGGGHPTNHPTSAQPGQYSAPPMAQPTVPPHSQQGYNYAPPRGTDGGQHPPYSQTAPPSQSYGHGYSDPRYDNPGPAQQQPYPGQVPAQPGHYPDPAMHQGYPPQQVSRPPPYGVAPQGNLPQTYPQPAASQPGNVPYQAPSYQQYPYASSAMPQAPYGAAPAAGDGHNQLLQPSYPQQVSQPVPTHGQQAPVASYAQYPSSQPVYPDQAAPAGGTMYGYQGGQLDPSAYAGAGQAYSAPPAGTAQPGYTQPVPTPTGQTGYAQPVPTPAGQPGYAQTVPNPAGYEQQQVPQAAAGGYASVPGGAPPPNYG